MATIVVLGALDTKGLEVQFLAAQIEQRGHYALVVDTGVMGEPAFTPAVTRRQVADAAGTTLDALVGEADRGQAVTAMAAGVQRIVLDLLARGALDAIVGLGGGAGTSIGTAAMRALPLGIPKVMVSTLASGDVRGFVGPKDIVMVPAIVDVCGLNRISRGVFTRAAAAVCGMVEARVPDEPHERPIIVASMFGNTTKCVEAVRARLDPAGFETLVFHAVGVGGQTMEGLIETGHVAGVLDVTLTEWADELVGGVLSAGPARLDAAARTGTPAVIAPGCLDMVNFWGPETIPERLRGRRIYQHNANTMLVRTDPDENAQLGRIIAGKLNRSRGPVAVYLPLRGLSVISSPGGPYHWPEADQALFDALRAGLRPDIPVHALDVTINDPLFAEALADGLLAMLAVPRAAGTGAHA